MNQYVTHTLPPVYDANSTVLILGTMPSPKSREVGFYYGHPQNRFWRVLPDLFEEKPLDTIAEKKEFLHRHHLALWDVLQSCTIAGAEDSSIREPVANDFRQILQKSAIRTIFTTGAKANSLYKKYCLKQTGIEAIALPSTSPANCRMHYEELRQAYAVILEYV